MSEKKLQAVVDAINKKYGKGAIMRLGDTPAVDVETFSTGSLGLDIATGIGGFPRGRVSSVSGPESSGKTSLTIHAIADCQKKGYTAAFIDVEHAFDPKYARNLGVNTDDLIFSQPNSAEEALNIAEELVKSGDIDLLIIDSIAALVPQQEIEGEMGDAKLGLQARLMSQAMRKLTPIVHKNNCALILLNQIREKIGVMFGNPETEPGGNAIKFYASLRLDIRRSGSGIKDKEGVMEGNSVKVKVVKNKLAPPFRVAQFDIIYGKGVSLSGEVVDLAADLNIIQKSGAWYSYNDAKIGQGRENTKQFLEDNPEVLEEVMNKIKESYQ